MFLDDYHYPDTPKMCMDKNDNLNVSIIESICLHINNNYLHVFFQPTIREYYCKQCNITIKCCNYGVIGNQYTRYDGCSLRKGNKK